MPCHPDRVRRTAAATGTKDFFLYVDEGHGPRAATGQEMEQFIRQMAHVLMLQAEHLAVAESSEGSIHGQ